MYATRNRNVQELAKLPIFDVWAHQAPIRFEDRTKENSIIIVKHSQLSLRLGQIVPFLPNTVNFLPKDER